MLITGGSGFIGSHFAALAPEVRSLDRSDWNFRNPWPVMRTLPVKPEYFIHFGANVKARQSVEDPAAFVADNAVGTFHVLELARLVKPELFVYISSAEALGGCDKGYLDENALYRPSNPYAATKAMGEVLTLGHSRTYKIPVLIVRTQCVWSMDQKDPTKAVPIIKKTILAHGPVKIYTRNGVPGSRQWIEVEVFCRRLLDLIPKVTGMNSISHIVGEERNNLEMAQYVADRLGHPLVWEEQEISPTHEWRYAIKDSSL